MLDSAPGVDSLPNYFLQTLGSPFVDIMTIAFFNMIGKLIETATAKRLRDAAEAHILFSNSQMRARPGRSTETALELLTEQIYTA